jgi:hypothetical protein
MGAKVGGKKGGAMADINVTPLVDVCLVLLIIFMVVTPMLSSGVDVKLPKVKTAEEEKDMGQHLVRRERLGVGLRQRCPDGLWKMRIISPARNHVPMQMGHDILVCFWVFGCGLVAR